MFEASLIYAVPVTSLAIAGFFIVYFKKKRISVANPTNLATIGWLVPFAMTPLLLLSPYYETWRLGLNLFFLVNFSFLTFTLGNFIGYSAIRPRRCIDAPTAKPDPPVVSMDRFRKQANLVFLAGMVGYANNIINVVDAGGISVYTELGLREAELTFGSNTLMNYLYFMNILAFLMFVYLRHVQRDNRLGDLIIITLTSIALLSHGVKGTIVWPMVMALILIHTDKKLFSWSILWPALLLVLIVFMIVTVGRQLPFIIDGRGDVDEAIVKSALNLPLYFSTGFVNLQLELEKFRDFALGWNTLAPFYEVFSFAIGDRRSLDVTAAAEEFLHFNAYNTATFLRDPYRDFGIVGIALFPLLYGLITSLLFGISTRSRSPYAIIAYSIYSAAIFGMFFSNHFQKIQYLFLVTICFFLSRINGRRAKTLKAETV